VKAATSITSMARLLVVRAVINVKSSQIKMHDIMADGSRNAFIGKFFDEGITMP
jgi:hypothetical protein